MITLIENKEPDFNKKIQISLTVRDFTILTAGLANSVKSDRDSFYKIHGIPLCEGITDESDLLEKMEIIIAKFVPNYCWSKNEVDGYETD